MNETLREKCKARLSKELHDLKEFRAGGGKSLGYFCKSFAPATAAGLGLWPVRVLCESEGDNWLAGEKLLRPDVCPLVKSFLGGLSERKGIYADIDAWMGLFTCDQMKRGFHHAVSELDAVVHPVHLPSTHTSESEDYYVTQIRRFMNDVEAIYDVRFDPDKAYEWQKEYVRNCDMIARAVISKAMSPLDMQAMFGLLFLARPHGLAEFIEKTLYAYPSYISDKTVIVTGGPIALHDSVLYEELEKAGLAVMPLNCTGLDAFEALENPIKSDGILERLARNAFRTPHCARTRPNTLVYERLHRYVSLSGASAIIIKNLKYCDFWYAERKRASVMFDVPVLYIDSDFTSGGVQRVKNRISAFLEIL